MKHIKVFEEYNTSEFVKLFSHILNFFRSLKGKYQVNVMSNISHYSFGVTKYIMKSFKLFTMFRILPLTDKDHEYFVLYYYPDFEYYFDKHELELIDFIQYITDNYKIDDAIPTNKIPNIIENINIDSFEAYLDTKKYNL